MSLREWWETIEDVALISWYAFLLICEYVIDRLRRAFRWLVPLVVLITCATCGKTPRRTVEPLSLARINPPEIWQYWGQRSIDCAKMFLERADSATFTVVHDSVDVSQFVWLIVATEREDGGFPCRGQGDSVGSCGGQFRAPDTILISVQRTGSRPIISHEIMHWAIESAGEKNWQHGPPWGLCEYF